MTVDTVLYNGAVYTMDPAQPRATALALQGNRIVAVGDDESMRPLLASGGCAVDLKGCCVIPGLIDAHLHFEGFSLQLDRLDAEAPTCNAVLERVARRLAEKPDESWIRGHGWNHNAWGGDFPSAALLDRVAPKRPVFLSAKSGHAGWANSVALQRAGINRDTPDPPGGALVRDGGGEPTGILLETAMDLVRGIMPQPTVDQVLQALRTGVQQAQRLGLTGVHDLDGSRAFAAWQRLRQEGGTGLRVCKSLPAAYLDQALDLGLRSGLGDGWLRLGGIKIFADGALGPRTAWMLAPYEDEPDNCGMSLLAEGELLDLVQRASRGGLASFVHAIGDRACRQVIDVLAQVRAEEAQRPGHYLRHRIEHVQTLDPADWGRLAEHDLVASMQPIHATSDMEMADRLWGARGRGTYAFQTLLERGTVLAFGSDTPVEPISPLIGIHAAVTRRRADGRPGPDGWYPDQRLSVEDAMRGYTAGAAWASGEEGDKGSLTAGKWADLVVLEEDIFCVSPMDIAAVAVAATMVDGRFVFAASGFDTGQ
ncbi:MAG: amidohydrolase family protein [Candidatus Latescibacteria bacterium]|nr:amidohydrolase family protein [Candidatus Latescibacterota bacterium]